MQIAPTLKLCSSSLVAAILLAACSPNASVPHSAIATVSKLRVSRPETARTKTESVQGEFVGAPFDCDGDGLSDDSRIDFDGDGVSDECVDAAEAIPEPPFQQSYTPTREEFNRLLPAVGSNALYQCGDDLYEVSLHRPSENQLEYSSDGLTLTTDIVYDDLDPNLNHPLIIQDPEAGVRYTFTQVEGNEFYEYALADYSGNVGLYIYQTGAQIFAAPCESTSESARVS